MLKKIESFGAKPVFLKKELLIQSLDFLEKEVGKLPQSYRNFLLHFGTSVLFDVNVFLKQSSLPLGQMTTDMTL